MSNIKKFRLNVNEPKTIATGLAPVIGYEPWPLRAIESLKQSLIDGNPVLIRVHSAADYPCENTNLTYKLDMESHAVLVVGYDDNERMFDVVNPWQRKWGGEYGGFEKLPYELMPVLCVNATAEKETILSLPTREIVPRVDDNGNVSLDIRLGYYEPKGYVIDRNNNAFTSFEISLTYNYNDTTRSYTQHLEGDWKIGELALASFPIGNDLAGKISFVFEVIATIRGERPYSYQDQIEFSFKEDLYFEKRLEKHSSEKISI